MLRTSSRTLFKVWAFFMAAAWTLSAGPQGPAMFPDAQYFVTAPGQKKAEPVKGTVFLDPTAKALRFQTKQTKRLEIPYDSITSMLYERSAKPRYAAGLLLAWPLLFTKSKNHFLTVQYKGVDGSGQFAIIQFDKDNYQMALAAAEAQTGKKIERSEEK